MEKVGVKKIAELARITLTEKDEANFETQLSEVIEYNASKLSETQDLPEKVAEPRQASDALGQSDDTLPALSQDDALANTQSFENGFIVVPRVFE